MLKFLFSLPPIFASAVNTFRVFSLAARVAAAFLFCAAGAALAQEEYSKAGEFEVEVGGVVIQLSESIVRTPSVSLRGFAEPLTLQAGMEIAPINEVIATATLAPSVLRLPREFFGLSLTVTANGRPLIVSGTQPVTILHNDMTVEVIVSEIRGNTVSFGDGRGNVITVVAAGDSLLHYEGTRLTTETIGTALTVLSSEAAFTATEFAGENLRLSGCATENDAVGGVGASGRFYLIDDFVDVSLETGFYATIQKGVMRLNCRMENVNFGDVRFDGDDVNQTARLSKSGEWGANSVFLGLRIEDEFGPARAYFRVGGNYWTREYDLPREFNVDGLHYAAPVSGEPGRNYYIPAPTLRWTGPEGILSEEKQDGFSSHFAFGLRFGRLSAGWSRNKQDHFRVDTYQFSYNHEF